MNFTQTLRTISHKTPRVIPIWLLVLSVLTLTSAISVFADEVKYEISGFGGDRALIIFTGTDSKSLTPSMNGTGTSARISGVQVAFRPATAAPLPSLISSVQQVKRGALTDLVINLSASSELGITPGAADTRIYFKRKGSSEPTNASTPPSAASKIITDKLSQAPIQISTIGPNSAAAGSITIALPDISVLSVNTAAAREFVAAAYISDLIGSWIFGIPVKFSINSKPKDDQDRADLEKLVKDLTAEVTSLREQLAAVKQPGEPQLGQPKP
jgi:hypothetical protein